MGVVTSYSGPFPGQAVMDMNGKEVSGRLLYVGRAQKRLERQNELKRRFEQMKQDRLTRYQVTAPWWQLLLCERVCVWRALNGKPSSSNPVSGNWALVVGRGVAVASRGLACLVIGGMDAMQDWKQEAGWPGLLGPPMAYIGL